VSPALRVPCSQHRPHAVNGANFSKLVGFVGHFKDWWRFWSDLDELELRFNTSQSLRSQVSLQIAMWIIHW
jgi:hypothetical protein